MWRKKDLYSFFLPPPFFSISTFLETSKSQLTLSQIGWQCLHWKAVEGSKGSQCSFWLRLTRLPHLSFPLFLFSLSFSLSPFSFSVLFSSHPPSFFSPLSFLCPPALFLSTAIPGCVSFSRPSFYSRILIRPWLHITLCAFVGWWMNKIGESRFLQY